MGARAAANSHTRGRPFARSADQRDPLTVTLADSDSIVATTASHTLTMDFGPAAPDRSLIAVIGGRQTSISGATVTIGGIDATVDVTYASTSSVIVIARASVPTGTSGDVVATWTGSASSFFMQASLFRLTGNVSEVVDTVTGTTSGAIDVVKDGALVAGASCYRTGAPYAMATWSGAPVSGPNVSSFYSTVYFSHTAAAASRAYTANATVTPAVTWTSAATLPLLAAVSYRS